MSNKQGEDVCVVFCCLGFFKLTHKQILILLPNRMKMSMSLGFLTPSCSTATVYGPLSSFLYLRTVHSYCKTADCAWCCRNTLLLVCVCQHFNQMPHYAKNDDNTDYQACLCITHLPGCSLLS